MPERISLLLRQRWITPMDVVHVWHLLVAATFFSEFFLTGAILVGNTDMLTLNFPMLLEAKRAFLAGRLDGWNPGILAGVANSGYAVAPAFSFENWLLFWLPEATLPAAATLLMFVKLWLLGTLAWHWFYLELASRRWALVASLAYQTCGWMLWSLAAYDTFTMMFYFTLAGWLVWSGHQRPASRQFLWLTLATLGLMFATNLSYAVYALVPLGLLTLYRSITRVDWGLLGLAVAVGMGCLAILTGLRILPLWYEISQSVRHTPCCEPDYTVSGLYFLRLFLPEIFSTSLVTSREVFSQMPELSPTLQLHTSMQQFYGVSAALLALMALLLPGPRKSNGLAVAAVILLAILSLAQPFDFLLRGLLYPRYHYLSLQSWLPAVFCLLVGYGGLRLEQVARGRLALQQVPWLTGLLVVWLAGSMMVTLARYQHVWAPFETTRWLVLLLMAVAVALLFPGQRPARLLTMARNLLVFLILAVLLWTITTHQVDADNEALLIYETMSLLMVAMLGWQLPRLDPGVWLALGLGILLVWYPWPRTIHSEQTLAMATLLALVGLLRFLLIAAIFLNLLHQAANRTLLPSRLFGILLVLVLAEAMGSMKVNRQIIINPLTRETLYPERAHLTRFAQTADAMRYRVFHSIRATRSPILQTLHGPLETCSTHNLVYGLRAYGGYYNLIPREYVAFLSSWLGEQVHTTVSDICVYAVHEQPRLLDVLAVGYRYDFPDDRLIRRPTALARLTWFGDWQVVNSLPAAVERLRDEAFDIHQQVVLNQSPDLPPSPVPAPAQPLVFTENGPDRLHLEVNQAQAGVVAFLDVYHPGWQAWIDGQPAPILRANGPFMAVAVPAGPHTLTWRFFPPMLKVGIPLAGLGGLFLLLAGWVLVRRDRQQALPPPSPRHPWPLATGMAGLGLFLVGLWRVFA